MQTPWGSSDHTIKLARGVVWVSTPSHGGFLFTRTAAAKLLTEHARKAAEPWRDGFAFEEDCKYAIVLFEHPEFSAGNPDPEKIKADALHTISMWDADYLLARGITPEPKAYAYFLRNREEDRLRAERSPDLIVAASGDWADWVPKGRVGVHTADGLRYTVPESEYRKLQATACEFVKNPGDGLTLLSRLHDVQPVRVNAQDKGMEAHLRVA